MLSFAQARAQMLEAVPQLGTELKPLANCLDQVLAEDVLASEPIPPFDNSAMDGYAVRADDVEQASSCCPVHLEVVESVPAGQTPTQTVFPGQATRIMTGAMMPEGANTVVRVEDTRAEGDGVEVLKSVPAGKDIRLMGENVHLHERVLKQGIRIRPQEVSMLASLNRSDVCVCRRPVVAVLSTGDELTPLGEALRPGKIRDSNRYGICAQVWEAGGIPMDMGIVRDDAHALEDALREAAHRSDAVVTSGGISVGDYDIVKDVLSQLGQINFWKVAMKPGKPQAYGQLQGKPFFGLPGNPVSSMVVFELFVRPALRRMAGHADLFRPLFPAYLEQRVENPSDTMYFLRVVLNQEDGRTAARTTGPQGSGILQSLVLANGLLHVPPRTSLKPGDSVQAQWLS